MPASLTAMLTAWPRTIRSFTAPSSVTTAKIQVNGTDRHYALVASFNYGGVQIIDITDPSRPSVVASVADSTEEIPTNYSELQRRPPLSPPPR